MRHRETVAVVGIGGIFPGAPTLQAFWDAILHARSAASEVPEGRWILSKSAAFAPEIGALDRVYSTRGCFIDEVPKKSTIGLHLAADTLRGLDPAFHLLLHAGYQAYHGAKTENADPARTGVIIGNLALPTDSASALSRDILGRTIEEKILGKSRTNAALAINPLNRHVLGMPAGLLAQALGLGGEALALDAACASSLYAVKLAVDELLAGRADAVLAGGLSRPDSLFTQMGFSQLRALSPTGVCSPFDEKGDGLVVGEGAGILLLKRTEDAIRHGDTIHAVIRGIGLSNDVGGSLLAPMTEGQLRAMRAAYDQAGWQPHSVDLIECHATGTPVGDAVEVESLGTLWGQAEWEAGQCVIGSVKSNIGHLLTAAGSAALIKTILAIQHKTLPPTANFERPAPNVSLPSSPFQVLTKPKPWRRRSTDQPRRAAVSAFGFGGINAHVLLEEFQPPAKKSAAVSKPAEPSAESNPIAVVGMAAHFGPWKTLRAFQERVLGGDPDHSPKPPARWWGVNDSAWYKLHGSAESSAFPGYYLGELAVPADRFRIPPRELAEMLPQQLLMLEAAANALADAGLHHAAKDQTPAFPNMGVFIGLEMDLNTTNYSVRWSMENKGLEWAEKLGLAPSRQSTARNPNGDPPASPLTNAELQDWIAGLRDAANPPLTANRTMGGLGSIVASRIAREFRIGGPSFALSTGETSGLTALEIAVRQLQSRELNQAIVGAVDLAGDVRNVITASDSAQNLNVIGEGAAAVVLKRHEDAVRDGDRIYAVIRGVHGAARPVADSDTLACALSEAGLPQSAIELLDTSCAGDLPIDPSDAEAPVVTNAAADIGHCGAATGLASFVKACLCVYHEILPASQTAHGTPRPAQYWLRNRAVASQTAAVTCSSVTGAHCAVVLSAADHAQDATVQTERLQPLGARREALFSVEANNAAALSVGLTRLRSRAEHTPDIPIETLARLWWNENRNDPHKPLAVALVARDTAELIRQIDYVLQSLAEDPERRLGDHGSGNLPPALRDRVFFAPQPAGRNAKVAFIFPGSGNQYLGMGRELSLQWPEVFRKQDHENRFLRDQFQPDLFWNSTSIDDINNNHKAALFGQVALGTAVGDLVQSFGVRPEAVIGYSLGETAGLFALKAWTDRDLMLERINASTLFTEDLAGACNAARKAWKLPQTKTVDWALGVIDRPAKVVRAAMKDHKKVYSLIVNTLHECVVGGDAHAVAKLVKKLDCEFFPLHGVTTVHCEVAKEVQEPYRDLHLLDTTPPRGIRFYSGAWGTAYNLSRESAADSVLAQAIYGIDYPKVIEAAYDDGVRVFLEMGPGASCTRMIREILGDRPHLAKSACYSGQDAVSTVLRFAAHLVAERVPLDLSVLYGQDTAVPAHALETKTSAHTINVPIGGNPFKSVVPSTERSAVAEPPPPKVETPAPAPESPAIVPFQVPVNTPPAPAAPQSQKPQPRKFPARPLPMTADAPTGTDWLDGHAAAERANADAHAAFLDFAQTATAAMTEALTLQMKLIERLASPGEPLPGIAVPQSTPEDAPQSESPKTTHAPPRPLFDRDACREIATGSLANVLGPGFAEVDTHPTRVRLPGEPLMLVDRILSIAGEPKALAGEPKSLASGRIVTEHDIHPGAWYLDCGRIPTCIAVEAGQADLFLGAYLGIDFITKGLAVYRLLDAEVTFHRPLPAPGETIRYDIRIERFFRQGDTWLFRFNFDATLNGQPLLSMRDGCAGFFTQEDLNSGKGIIQTALDKRPIQGTLPGDWTPLVPMEPAACNESQLNALRNGDLAQCFGPLFANLPLKRPAGLPGGTMKLVDRILELDPNGGRFGLGIIRAELDIFPDDWFLTCHFVDDRVMPGTLMYECCLHTLRVFLLRMGWVGEEGAFVYEPVPGVGSKLKCRGQVIESTEKALFEITLKELGYNPHPFAIADALMYADGKPIVEITNMSIQLTGLTRETLEQTWNRPGSPTNRPAPATPLYGNESITAFATGNPSEAFGEPYKPFDNERKIARLPGPPYKFLDRIIRADAEPWKMAAGGSILAEYDIPPDEWYFAAERQNRMPFAVLLEVALQPCGWFAAYMGSALTSDADLRFRNLGGKAVQFAPVTPSTGTLATHVRCTGVSHSGGMIIQHYTFDVRANNRQIYTGSTYFGFFTHEALANQIGIRGAQPYQPAPNEKSVSPPFPYPTDPPYPDAMLRMIDTIQVFDPKGGPNGIGCIQGTANVDPSAWFFKAHFHQDPVWPGSLGLESFLQLLKYAAVERWAVTPNPQLQAAALNTEHAWTYRGQILPTGNQVTVNATITNINDQTQTLTANGHLSIDNRVIYAMENFALHLKF